jgi:hypothetical protein
MLTHDVLDQSAAAGNVQSLNAETDSEYRHCAVLGLSQREQVGLVLLRVYLSELRVGLSPIAKRIYIGIAPGQQQPVKFAHHLFDKILLRDQSNVNRQPTGGLNGLAVKSRQVKPISLKFETHRDANAWAYLWFHLLALSLWNIAPIISTTRAMITQSHCRVPISSSSLRNKPKYRTVSGASLD